MKLKTGNHWLYVLAVVVLVIPLTARADAGTPLMWAGILHLVLGNLFIGIIEGVILANVFNLNIWLCILVMIPANYFSAWFGDLFLNAEISRVLPFELYTAWHWIWAMVVFTYLMTLVLEWPFVFFCFRKSPDRLKRSLWGNLLVQSASYILLFSWYAIASGTTLYTQTHVVAISDVNFSKRGLLYFISQTNGTVCVLDLSSSQTQKIASLGKVDSDDRLVMQASTNNPRHWDLLETSRKFVICSNLPVETAVYATNSYDRNTTIIRGTWMNCGEAPKLGNASTSDWKFRTGFWPIEGLRGTNEKTGESIYLALETPFVAWIARNATQLSDDSVVFQLGEDQICLFEPASKKLCLLARGQGPVVVLPIEGKSP
jgi:hypothetical protein